MGKRATAEEEIRRWVSEFHLDQKVLACEVGVSPSAICHILNDPEYAISGELAQRITSVVQREARTRARIDSLEMEVVGLCHDTDFLQDGDTNKTIIAQVKSALVTNAIQRSVGEGAELPLCRGVRAVLIRLGGSGSRIFLIAVNVKNSDEENRAVAHELEHLKATLLRGVAKNATKPPKSSF